MTSASSTSARSLFGESKLRLADKVQVNVNNIASLSRLIQRGSKTSEILMHSTKNFTQLENGIENAENSLKKIGLIGSYLDFQLHALEKNLSKLEDVTEQARSMQR